MKSLGLDNYLIFLIFGIPALTLFILSFSDELETNFAETDQAINKVIPWRDNIPVKVFASQIRFQIRLDDIRDIVRGNETTVDAVLAFYNEVIDALLDQYSLEFKVVSGSATWKQMIVYKNILRAIGLISHQHFFFKTSR